MHHHRQPGGGRGRVRQSPPFPVALRGGQVPGGSRAPAPRFPTRLGGNGDGGARGARAGGVPPCPPRGGDARRRAAGGGYVTTLRSTMSPAARGGRGGGGPSREPAGDKAVGEAPAAPPASAASLGGSPGGPRCQPPPAGDATHRGGEVRRPLLRPSAPLLGSFWGALLWCFGVVFFSFPRGAGGLQLLPVSPLSRRVCLGGGRGDRAEGRGGGGGAAAELPALRVGEPGSAGGKRAVPRSSLRAPRGGPSLLPCPAGAPVSVAGRFSPRVYFQGRGGERSVPPSRHVTGWGDGAPRGRDGGVCWLITD